jgi:hypothetical protein
MWYYEFKWLEDLGRVVSDYHHIYDHGIYKGMDELNWRCNP